LVRIVYCIWLIVCDYLAETGVPALRSLGWCETRRELGGGRRVAYFLVSAKKSLIWGMCSGPAR